MYLGNALERIRIVIDMIAFTVLGQQLTHDLCHCTLTSVHAHTMDALVEGTRVPFHA